MKTKNVLAIITASAMMCSLCGCGSTASDASAAELSVETVGSASEATVDNAGDAGGEAKTDAADSADSEAGEEAATEISVDLSSLTDDAFVYNGKKVSILDDVETTLATLGEPVKMNEGAGGITYYDYGTRTETVDEGITLVTFEDNGKEVLGQIDINIEGPQTAKGIGTGSSKEDVIAAYGEPTEDAKVMLKYKFDNYELSFVTGDNDKVTNIHYSTTAYMNTVK